DIGGSATLEIAVNDQIQDLGSVFNVQVATNGTLKYDANVSDAINSLVLEVGPLGGGTVNLAGGSTMTVTGNISVQQLGITNPSGATITGGTLALATYGTTAAATRTFL